MERKEERLRSARFVLQLVLESIESNQLQQLRELLPLIPLSGMSDEAVESLLLKLLQCAMEFNRVNAAATIMGHFGDVDPMNDARPLGTTIFTIPSFSDRLLKFANGDVTVHRHLINLMEYGEGAEVREACDKLLKIYGPQSEGVYRAVLSSLEQQGIQNGLFNRVIYEHVREVLPKVTATAEKPGWVISPAEGSTLPSHTSMLRNVKLQVDKLLREVGASSESDEQLVESLFNLPQQVPGFSMEGVEEVKSKIIQQISTIATDEQKRELRLQILLQKVEYSLATNRDIFRVLGPSHPLGGIAELDSRSDNPCSRYGGCRLFTCYEFENVDSVSGDAIEEDLIFTRNYEAVEWFTGSCMYCLKIISAKHYAVRMPMDDGGWSGCYCSWNHVRMDIPMPNPIRVKLVENFEKEYNIHGILDRKWNEVQRNVGPLRTLVTPPSIMRSLGYTDDSGIVEGLMEEIEEMGQKMAGVKVGAEIPTFQELKPRAPPSKQIPTTAGKTSAARPSPFASATPGKK